MTDRKTELEGLLAAATPGPWAVDGPPNNQIIWSGPESRVAFMAHSDGCDVERDKATAALIVFLRNNAHHYLALMEENERLRDDAMRYRWLRDKSCPPHNFYISVPIEFHAIRYTPGEVDAYIDDARQALQETTDADT